MQLTAPAPHATRHPARRARRKEARPGELLDAALTLFVEKGFAATRVEEVAARAGVSKGTLFLYFPSKEALFKAVVRENASRHLRPTRCARSRASPGPAWSCCTNSCAAGGRFMAARQQPA